MTRNIEINEKDVKELITENLNIENAYILPVGHHELDRHYVFEIKTNISNIILKFYGIDGKWENEVFVLSMLKIKPFIPRIIKYGKYKKYNFILMEKIEGNMVDNIWYNINLKQKKILLYNLGKTLAEIHNTSNNNFFGYWDENKAFRNIYDYRKEKDDAVYNRLLSNNKKNLDYFNNAYNKLKELQKELVNIKAVTAHRDFCMRNMIVDNNMSTKGIIDFEHTVPDDPCMDLCTILQTDMFDDIRLFNSFKEGYKTEKEFPISFFKNRDYYILSTGLYLCCNGKINYQEKYKRGIKLIDEIMYNKNTFLK